MSVKLYATAALVSLALAPPTSPQPKDAPRHRLVPIRPMSQDVEILYGDPESVGQPFVMRIRELPGGVIPPHRHPVDEHITVLRQEPEHPLGIDQVLGAAQADEADGALGFYFVIHDSRRS